MRDPEGQPIKTGATSVTFVLDKKGVVRHVHPGGPDVEGDPDDAKLYRRCGTYRSRKAKRAARTCSSFILGDESHPGRTLETSLAAKALQYDRHLTDRFERINGEVKKLRVEFIAGTNLEHAAEFTVLIRYVRNGEGCCRVTLDRKQPRRLRPIYCAQSAAQDRQALADFYDAIAGLLYSVSCRILGDAHEAEEVVQDVFVQIWNKAATFDPGVRWPFELGNGITRNRSIDRLRARHRRERLSDELLETNPDQCDRIPRPRMHLPGKRIAKPSARPLRPAPEQRQAIELAFFAGLTHAEIAEKMDELLGTIKARIRAGDVGQTSRKSGRSSHD